MKIFTVAVIMTIVATLTVSDGATNARLDVDYMESKYRHEFSHIVTR